MLLEEELFERAPCMQNADIKDYWVCIDIGF